MYFDSYTRYMFEIVLCLFFYPLLVRDWVMVWGFWLKYIWGFFLAFGSLSSCSSIKCTSFMGKNYDFIYSFIHSFIHSFIVSRWKIRQWWVLIPGQAAELLCSKSLANVPHYGHISRLKLNFVPAYPTKSRTWRVGVRILALKTKR